MSTSPEATKVVFKFDDVAPPSYQEFDIVGPLNTAAEQLLAQQLHFHLLSVPPNSGLQLPRETVTEVRQLITDNPELRVFRACVRWDALDPNFTNQAEVRDANELVAWFIIKLLESRSPVFSAHLARDGYVRCRVFPDCLQFWFPNFRFN